MKVNSNVSKLLTNKLVLNIIALLSLFNVIGYIVMGNINAVLYYIILAVLIRYFSKNMIIVLGIPLILVNLLALKGNIMEGMENATDTSNENKNGIKTDEDQQKNNKLVKNNKSKLDPKTSQGLTMTNINSDVNSDVNTEENAAQTTNGKQQGFESGRKKNRGNEIDYASTIEDAYDELNNILGGDGIKRLTSDTQNLMKQQMQLAEAMKGMTPVMQQIAPMVENLKGMMGQMGDGKEGLGSVLDLAKKFSSQTS